jgi:N-acetylated-alpha-linked acidic dipeptidase
VIYFNSDGNGRGYLDMEGSHTLEHFINDVARDIPDPETKVSVWERLHRFTISDAKNDDDRKEARQRTDQRVKPLGSGSDYTAFIDHLGIASLNLGYGGEDRGGIYHSIYDDFYWFTHFSDADFVYGRALSQTLGTAVMRVADADLLPFEFTSLADTIRLYVKQLKKLADDSRNKIIEQNKEIEEGVFVATNDPRRPRAAPKHEDVPPYLNFAPLDNLADALTQSANRYQAALKKQWPSGIPAATLRDLNQKLMESERCLTSPEGLLRRPWYKHIIYAPGVYAGYGAKTLPGVREAIEQKKWAEADSEIVRAANVLAGENTLINTAAGEIEQAAH